MATESLKLMKELLANQFLFLVCSTINMFMCTLSLLVLIDSKIFRTRSFELLKMFMISDLVCSVYMIFYSITHLYVFFHQIPEVIDKRLCFLIAGFQFFIYTNNHCLTLAISIDRLISFVKPHFHLSQTSNKINRLILIATLVISAFVYVSGLLDTFSPGALLYCSAIGNGGEYMTTFRWLLTIAMNYTVLCIYTVIIVKSLFKSHYNTTDNSNNNLAEKRKKISRQLTKVLSFTATLYTLSTPLHSAAVLVLNIWAPELILILGFYIGIMSVTEGSVYTLSFLVFLPDFRKELRKTTLSRLSTAVHPVNS